MEEIVTNGHEVNPTSTEQVVLTNEERLEAENLALHVRLAAVSKEKIVNEANARLEHLNKQLRDYQGRIVDMQNRLSTKYGVDFSRQQIEPDTGRIIPTSM